MKEAAACQAKMPKRSKLNVQRRKTLDDDREPLQVESKRFRWVVVMWATLRCDVLEKGNRMQCDQCGSEQFTRAGRDRLARQLYRCAGCGRRMTTRSGSAFSGYRFPDDVIALAVRWYLRFRSKVILLP